MFGFKTSGGAKTTPMTVKNTGFLLDRMGQDCHPLQFLRELTRNAIEAIQRTGSSGQVLWDVDWTTSDLRRSSEAVRSRHRRWDEWPRDGRAYQQAVLFYIGAIANGQLWSGR